MGVGPKDGGRPASQVRSLENLFAAGRFDGQADGLRLYRSIATMDRKVPLPLLKDQVPTWAKASSLARNGNRSPTGWRGWQRRKPENELKIILGRLLALDQPDIAAVGAIHVQSRPSHSRHAGHPRSDGFLYTAAWLHAGLS